MFSRQANPSDLKELAHLFDQYRLFYKQKSDIPKAEAKRYVQAFGGKGSELTTAKDNELTRALYTKEGFEEEREFLTYFWKAITS